MIEKGDESAMSLSRPILLSLLCHLYLRSTFIFPLAMNQKGRRDLRVERGTIYAVTDWMESIEEVGMQGEGRGDG